MNHFGKGANVEESKDTPDNVDGDNRIKLGPVFGYLVDLSISIDGDAPSLTGWDRRGFVTSRRPFDAVTVNLIVDSKDYVDLLAWARDKTNAKIRLRKE